MAKGGIEVTHHQFALRFIHGHRYLDRCGEALIRLEDKLGTDWLTIDPVPTNGGIKNELVGIAIQFNATVLSAQQSEFIDFDMFRDAVCKAKDILVDVFGIKRVHVPTARFILQKGCDSGQESEAEEFVRKLGLVQVSKELHDLMGGESGPLDFAFVTEARVTWDSFPVQRRRRLHAAVVRQEPSPTFDNRVIQRTHLLPSHQRDAIAGMASLRRKHKAVAPLAAQFDLECSMESEFPANEMNLQMFLNESYDWAERLKEGLVMKSRGLKQ
jgi:hypothetical protein